MSSSGQLLYSIVHLLGLDYLRWLFHSHAWCLCWDGLDELGAVRHWSLPLSSPVGWMDFRIWWPRPSRTSIPSERIRLCLGHPCQSSLVKASHVSRPRANVEGIYTRSSISEGVVLLEATQCKDHRAYFIPFCEYRNYFVIRQRAETSF